MNHISRYSHRSSRRSAASNSRYRTEDSLERGHSPPTQVYHNLNYLAPSPWTYPSYPADSGVPSWNFLFASNSSPSSEGSFHYSPYRRPSFASPPSPSSVYSFSSCESLMTVSSARTSPFSPSPSPQPRHVVCSAPLHAPIPRKGSKPVVLDCELPDMDEDLSHGPYVRPSKRKRREDAGETSEPVRKLRRSARLQA